MKRNILKLIITLLGFQLALGCTPDDYEYPDNSFDVSRVDSVALVANHVMVLADGRAQLELYPKLFTKEKLQIPDYRVNPEWLEYTETSGVTPTRYFSTSDAALIGKTLTTQLKIKGTDLISNAVSFEVVAPQEQQYTSEIKIPVIFHIVQTTEDITSFGGAYAQDQIMKIFTKLNNMLNGEASANPVGVNTHIQLALALYDQYGRKLAEPGINRLTVREIDNKNGYEDFLSAQHLIWPADKYFNIWLISDRSRKTENFGTNVTSVCKPVYVYPGTADLLEGIAWQELPEGTSYLAKEAGVIYKLQELDVISRSFFEAEKMPGYNDLAAYLGLSLGLLPTCSYQADVQVPDYCNDTHDYFPTTKVSSGNKGWYKEANGCYFKAENIMDDPMGSHGSVSKEQNIRMRWVLEHCPQRAAWKSDFAFTGK